MELTKKRFYGVGIFILTIIGMVSVIAPSVSHPAPIGKKSGNHVRYIYYR